MFGSSGSGEAGLKYIHKKPVIFRIFYCFIFSWHRFHIAFCSLVGWVDAHSNITTTWTENREPYLYVPTDWNLWLAVVDYRFLLDRSRWSTFWPNILPTWPRATKDIDVIFQWWIYTGQVFSELHLERFASWPSSHVRFKYCGMTMAGLRRKHVSVSANFYSTSFFTFSSSAMSTFVQYKVSTGAWS